MKLKALVCSLSTVLCSVTMAYMLKLVHNTTNSEGIIIILGNLTCFRMWVVLASENINPTRLINRVVRTNAAVNILTLGGFDSSLSKDGVVTVSSWAASHLPFGSLCGVSDPNAFISLRSGETLASSLSFPADPSEACSGLSTSCLESLLKHNQSCAFAGYW